MKIRWKYNFIYKENLIFSNGNQTFLSFGIIRAPAYQGQSDSEYLTSLASQKPHSPERSARPPLLLKYCADSRNLASPASL